MEIPASYLRQVYKIRGMSRKSTVGKRIYEINYCKFMALQVFFGTTFLCRSPHPGIIKVECG